MKDGFSRWVNVWKSAITKEVQQFQQFETKKSDLQIKESFRKKTENTFGDFLFQFKFYGLVFIIIWNWFSKVGRGKREPGKRWIWHSWRTWGSSLLSLTPVSGTQYRV